MKWEEFRTDLWISGRITFLFVLTEVSKPKGTQEDGSEGGGGHYVGNNVGCSGGSRILRGWGGGVVADPPGEGHRHTIYPKFP